MTAQDIPHRIRSLRARLGMTNYSLGERLGVHMSTIARWCSGTATPYQKHMDAIAALEKTLPRIPGMPEPSSAVPDKQPAPAAPPKIEQAKVEPQAPTAVESMKPAPKTPEQILAEGAELARELALLPVNELVQRLQQYAHEHHLTHAYMADELNVSSGDVVWNWLSGKHKPIPNSQLAIIRLISGVKFLKLEGGKVVVHEPAAVAKTVVKEVNKYDLTEDDVDRLVGPAWQAGDIMERLRITMSTSWHFNGEMAKKIREGATIIVDAVWAGVNGKTKVAMFKRLPGPAKE